MPIWLGSKKYYTHPTNAALVLASHPDNHYFSYASIPKVSDRPPAILTRVHILLLVCPPKLPWDS